MAAADQNDVVTIGGTAPNANTITNYEQQEHFQVMLTYLVL